MQHHILPLIISGVCDNSTFKCMGGTPACLPKAWVCDGEQECLDGSDEDDGLCSK